MKLIALFIILSYCIVLYFSVKKYNNSTKRILYFPMLLCATITTFLSIPTFIYFIIYNDSSYFFNLNIVEISYGAIINLVYLIFWILGYLYFINKNKNKYIKIHTSINNEKVVLSFLLISICGFVWFSSQKFDYAYSRDIYTSLSDITMFFGILGELKEFMSPIAGAMLFYSYKKFNIGNSDWITKKYFRTFLYGILMLDIVLSLTIEMQRGDIFTPILIFSFIILFYKPKINVLKYLAIVLIILIFISPILDYMRAPSHGNKMISMDNLYDAITHNKNISSRLLSVEFFIQEFARKSMLTYNSAAMYKYVKNNGTYKFKTYPNIFINLIPRIIWKNKPSYPLSINGKNIYGTPEGIAAQVYNNSYTVLTPSGGGKMYFHLGWIGVIIAGFIVGYLWSYFTKYAFYKNNIFLLILYFINIKWGIQYFNSFGSLVLNILRTFRFILPFMLFSLIRKKVFFIKDKKIKVKYLDLIR